MINCVKILKDLLKVHKICVTDSFLVCICVHFWTKFFADQMFHSFWTNFFGIKLFGIKFSADKVYRGRRGKAKRHGILY